MDLLEHLGKRLLRDGGIATPRGTVITAAPAAATAAQELGPRVVLKSQVPTGKRGKSGGIRFASSPTQAQQAAHELLGAVIGGFPVQALLVEQAVDIGRELYAAILNDAESKSPMLIFSTQGGMDIEQVHASAPEQVIRAPLDIRTHFEAADAQQILADTDLTPIERTAVAAVLDRLYHLYQDVDAELVEVNPLVLTTDGTVLALDAKVSLDPGAMARHRGLIDDAELTQTRQASERVQAARDLGLALIELEGNVGVLANGAGLTMTTLDAVSHYGGHAANFLEIGGDAYTKATPALELVLSDPSIRSVVVNFCGAFARTDVMAEGVVKAIQELRPEIPFFFSIHGTGEQEAIAMVREGLSIDPFDRMDDAVKAAVQAAEQAEEVA